MSEGQVRVEPDLAADGSPEGAEGVVLAIEPAVLKRGVEEGEVLVLAEGIAAFRVRDGDGFQGWAGDAEEAARQGVNLDEPALSLPASKPGDGVTFLAALVGVGSADNVMGVVNQPHHRAGLPGDIGVDEHQLVEPGAQEGSAKVVAGVGDQRAAGDEAHARLVAHVIQDFGLGQEGLDGLHLNLGVKAGDTEHHPHQKYSACVAARVTPGRVKRRRFAMASRWRISGVGISEARAGQIVQSRTESQAAKSAA